MDLEARARWVDYAEAKDEMFSYTDIKEAPWYVVDADDKRAARLNIISHLSSIVPYEAVPHEKGGAARPPAAFLPAPAHRQPDVGARSATSSDEAPRCPAYRPGPVPRAQMRKYIIMGIQGSGKGTQAKLMAEDLELEHISVGDIFRWNVQHHTKLGAQVKRTVDSGHLVDDDLVESVVEDRLAQHDWNFGFIIDGFPRNARQAEFFLENYDIDGVINLYLPDEEVAARVLARRLCSQCGLDYNLIAHRPAAPERLRRVRWGPGGTGRRQSGGAGRPPGRVPRGDRPLIELFERKEFVATFDATKPIDEVQAAIRERFALPPWPGAS